MRVQGGDGLMAFPLAVNRRRVGGISGINWLGLEVIADNINKRGNSLNKTRKAAIDKVARDMEQYAQENAPWDDRSGAARSGLRGTAVHDDGKQVSTAYLAHTVDYGVYLETIDSGAFAIIIPTLLEFQGSFMSSLVSMDNFDPETGGFGGDLNFSFDDLGDFG